MSVLKEKRIVLGVCSGIAAYKSVELIRLVRKSGAEVQVVLTKSAEQFIAPLTFESMSGRPIARDLFDCPGGAMPHIDIARWADQILIAPATANTIAKLANGLADDLLSTLCIAAECPVAIAPAMNQAMWHHPATVHNIALLKERGVSVWGPGEGEQACGEFGLGRMLEPEALFAAFEEALTKKTLRGKKVVITAGPTREKVDPVRFISNRSSGKMGFALARCASRRGADVVLVAGPVAFSELEGVNYIGVESAEEMQAAVMANLSGADLFIGAAAVSDYRPVDQHLQKLKEGKTHCEWALEPTEDILKSVVASGKARYTVGFAAETHALETYALKKLRDKGCDCLIANLVGEQGRGFDADQNQVALYWKDHSEKQELALMPKMELADHLFDILETRVWLKD